MPAVAVLVVGCWQGVGPFIGEPHAEGEQNSRVSGAAHWQGPVLGLSLRSLSLLPLRMNSTSGNSFSKSLKIEISVFTL